MGWEQDGGDSTKNVCPVNLVDGYGRMLGHAGAEDIV